MEAYGSGRGVEPTPEVSDLWPRLLISPVLGTLIAHLTGLIDTTRHSTAGVIASDAYFSFVSFVIWSCNRWLYFRLSRREDWLQRPSRRLSVLLASTQLASTGIGLKNLSQRVKLATGRDVTWGVDQGRFVVRVPLVQC